MKLNLTLLFILSVLLFSGCKKSQSNNNTTTSEYYFKGTLNGKALSWNVTDDLQGWVTGTQSEISTYQGVTSGSLTAILSTPPAPQPKLAIEFRLFQLNSNQDITAYFNNFVNTGAWAYIGFNDFAPGTKAIAIYYIDQQGKEYTTIGSQAGGSLNVVAVTQVPPEPGRNESLKIKLSFSCTLYPDDGTGGNLSLTNVDATVRLEDLL